jgi:hypothetical protein
MIDPRSPSNDYNRTPIQINKYNAISSGGQDQNDDSINLNQPNLDEIESMSTELDSPFDNNSKKNIQKGMLNYSFFYKQNCFNL